MAAKNREREYARKRSEKFAARQERKSSKRRRNRAAGYSALGAVAVVAIVAASFAAINATNDNDTDVTASTSASPTGKPSADPAFSTTPVVTELNPGKRTVSATAKGDPCPTPIEVVDGPSVELDAAPDPTLAENRTWDTTIATTCGDIKFTLEGDKAPIAAASFVTLANAGFWESTLCHRLTTDGLYVLQCGDPTTTGTGGPGYSFGPSENVPSDSVYKAGTIAMANSGEYGNGSQFFIVYKDTTLPGSYTVLGTVTSGLDVVEKVAKGGVSPDAATATDGEPAWPIAIKGVSVQ